MLIGILSLAVISLMILLLIYVTNHRCKHEFEVIDRISNYMPGGDQNRPCGYTYVQRCKFCGKIKKTEIN